MRIPIGFVGSVLGAAILSCLTIVTLIALPPEGLPRWMAVGGIVALSLLIGVLINGMSIQEFRRVSQDQRETSNLYSTLTSQLNPVLCSGIENVLQRRVKDVDVFKDTDLTMNVFAPFDDGRYRMVGSTLPPGAPMRQRVQEPNEGMAGFIATKGLAGYARTAITSEDNDVYDRLGHVIGQRLPIRETNKAQASVGVKWVYGRPIFEKSGANPWSNKVVGIVAINSKAEDADNLYRNSEFQDQMDSLASDIAPYLNALHMLISKNKS